MKRGRERTARSGGRRQLANLLSLAGVAKKRPAAALSVAGTDAALARTPAAAAPSASSEECTNVLSLFDVGSTLPSAPLGSSGSQEACSNYESASQQYLKRKVLKRKEALAIGTCDEGKSAKQQRQELPSLAEACGIAEALLPGMCWPAGCSVTDSAAIGASPYEAMLLRHTGRSLEIYTGKTDRQT